MNEKIKVFCSLKDSLTNILLPLTFAVLSFQN